jgi:hypothetical protein
LPPLSPRASCWNQRRARIIALRLALIAAAATAVKLLEVEVSHEMGRERVS